MTETCISSFMASMKTTKGEGHGPLFFCPGYRYHGPRRKAQGARSPQEQGARRRTRTQDSRTEIQGRKTGRRTTERPPDHPEIKIDHAPWPSLLRRNWPLLERNTPYSKQLGEEIYLPCCFLLPSTPSRTATPPWASALIAKTMPTCSRR